MEKKKNSEKKPIDWLKIIPIISSVLVITLSLVLFFFAKGYSFDLSNNSVKQNGVITVTTRPILTDIYIDGEQIGKTTKGKGVHPGIHDVRAEKKGYHTWEKRVRVLPETNAIVIPWMLLEEPEKSIRWGSERTLINYWINKDGNIALILLQEADSTYSLLRYKLQNGLLDLTNNPNTIWTTPSKDFELTLSPNGNFAFLTIPKAEGRERYLINTSSVFTLESAKPLSLTTREGYEIEWAKDSKHLMLVSKDDILSYDVTSEITYSLLQKKEGIEYIWETDKNSNFYMLRNLTKEDDPVYTYAIEQSRLEGTGDAYLISNISMQKDPKYIEYYRTGLFNYIPFTNSIINTQTVGEITSFLVNPDIKGVFITTTSAAYWYDIESRTYMMINPYPSKILEFSRDNKSFLFESENSLKTFTFKKKSENPVEKTGLLPFTKATKENNIKWVDNSTYFSYVKEDKLYVAEKDGDNEIEVLPANEILFYSIESSKNIILTFENDAEGNFVINQYKIQ